MASEKRASEGIFLLSMYGDEDDEMEATDEQEEEDRVGKELVPPSSDAVAEKDDDGDDDEGDVGSHGIHGNTGQDERVSPLQQQQQILSYEFDSLHFGKKRLAIVDYGHEEGALSPEAEDEETRAADRVLHGEKLETVEGEPFQKKSPGMAQLSASGTHVSSPQILDQTDLPESYLPENNLESTPTDDVAMIPDADQKDFVLLAKFLQPPPKAKCSQDVQDKIIKFITLKKTTGRNFNSEVRNRKEYRNPDFLLHAMTYQKIDQIGSCFSKDVFDPHGYDKSDFYDELEADMKREMERKEQERRKTPKIDFASAGVQPVNAAPTPKISLPTPTSNAPPPNPDVAAREGRQNKKSKWDKVDPDPKIYTTIGDLDPSAAKTGGGYAAFARQRRRDSEEWRGTDKKAERRS